MRVRGTLATSGRPWWRRFALATLVAGLLAALAGAPAARAVSSTVVISQVQVAGATAADEFVELHNVGAAPFDLNGHRLVYRSAAGPADASTPAVVWTASTIIPPGGYYLIAAAPSGTPAQGYAGSVPPDTTYPHSGTGALAAAGGGLALRNGPANTGAVVDSVAYGTATNAFVEGTVAPAPAAGTSLARAGAGCQDTDGNSADFAALTPGAPRNSATAALPCVPATPGTPAATPTATATGTATATPLAARIHDIQGAAHRSPLNGAAVTGVSGVVTVRRGNGFFMQDPQPDGDERTSEGLFVFTAAAPSVATGDAVQVSGTVSEFRPGCAPSCPPSDNDFNNLTTTEIVAPPR